MKTAWFPIHTAPVDGTKVILFQPDLGIFIGAYVRRQRFKNGKLESESQNWETDKLIFGNQRFQPSHWMHLPDAPENDL